MTFCLKSRKWYPRCIFLVNHNTDYVFYSYLCSAKVIAGNAGERPANGRSNPKCMPPEAIMFCFGQRGFFNNQPNQSIMKPKLKFARVRIVWEQGRIPCIECPFKGLNGWEPVCSICMRGIREDNNYHPIIVANDR